MATLENHIAEYNKAIQRKFYEQNYFSYKWRKSIETVENALVFPQTKQDSSQKLHRNPNAVNIHNGGVYREDGEIVESSLHVASAANKNIPDLIIDKIRYPVEELTGTWVYGGFLKTHIGHLVTESLGRLWAFDDLTEKVQGLIFIHMNGFPKVVHEEEFSLEVLDRAAEKSIKANGYVEEIISFFSRPCPIKVSGRPFKVERLIVPSQLMGLQSASDLIGGHETYRLSVSKHISKNIPLDNDLEPLKLYVSRSKLSVASSSFFMESAFEAALSLEGYTILYPEKIGFTEQMALYARASHVILASGSACHVLALACSRHQHVALLNRHEGTWAGFGRQLRLMGAASVLELEHISGVFSPEDSSSTSTLKLHPARLVHSLDLALIWGLLRKNGFVSSFGMKLDPEEFSNGLELTFQALRLAYPEHGFVYQRRERP